MAWNYFNNELMYYLANKYRADINHDAKFRVLDLAEIPIYSFSFNKKPLDLWYNIIDEADEQSKLKKLLKTIVDEGGQGQAKDEFLIGAISAIDSGKSSANIDLGNSEWKSADTPEFTKEKIMGKRSNLLPIGFLESGTDAAKAIVRIELDDSTGTGFLIEGGWLLTNNHVIPTRADTATALVQLNYQYPKTTKTAGVMAVRVKPELEIPLKLADAGEHDFYTNETEDWSLIRLNPEYAAVLAPYGVLKFADASAKPLDFVNIIQHPLGGPKQIGIYNNMVMYADDSIIQYMTDTNDGSSGSPVLNSDWEVVAIHHSGGWLTDATTNTSVKRNQGTNIQKIKNFLASL